MTTFNFLGASSRSILDEGRGGHNLDPIARVQQMVEAATVGHQSYFTDLAALRKKQRDDAIAHAKDLYEAQTDLGQAQRVAATSTTRLAVMGALLGREGVKGALTNAFTQQQLAHKIEQLAATSQRLDAVHTSSLAAQQAAADAHAAQMAAAAKCAATRVDTAFTNGEAVGKTGAAASARAEVASELAKLQTQLASELAKLQTQLAASAAQMAGLKEQVLAQTTRADDAAMRLTAVSAAAAEQQKLIDASYVQQQSSMAEHNATIRTLHQQVLDSSLAADAAKAASKVSDVTSIAAAQVAKAKHDALAAALQRAKADALASFAVAKERIAALERTADETEAAKAAAAAQAKKAAAELAATRAEADKEKAAVAEWQARVAASEATRETLTKDLATQKAGRANLMQRLTEGGAFTDSLRAELAAATAQAVEAENARKALAERLAQQQAQLTEAKRNEDGLRKSLQASREQTAQVSQAVTALAKGAATVSAVMEEGSRVQPTRNSKRVRPHEGVMSPYAPTPPGPQGATKRQRMAVMSFVDAVDAAQQLALRAV